jgi:hypothetical protein
MWAVIALFAFIAWIVFGVISIVALAKKNGKAKKNLIIAIACFVVMVVGFAATPTDSDTTQADEVTAGVVSDGAITTADDDKAKAAEEEKLKAEAETKKLEEEAKAAEELKNNPGEYAKSVVAKHFSGGSEVVFDSSEGFLEVVAVGSDNFTNKMIKRGMWMGVMDVLEDLDEVDAIKDIAFNITFPMVDKFGNESQGVVMRVNLIADTRSKINFKNFITDNLPDIADSYWEHPSFSK